MDKLKYVEWNWNSGIVFTALKYESGKNEIRENKEPPPTKASHDIAHFICGFNGEMEWDYYNEPNHICEYNAVFVEGLLDKFSHYYYYNYPLDVMQNASAVDKHMEWFSEEYYHISRDHPSHKNYIQLKTEFFEKLNIEIVCRHFIQFYQTWLLEKICGNEKFNLTITMDSSIDFEFEPLYNYLNESKKILLK
jgi:hypothetical protein